MRLRLLFLLPFALLVASSGACKPDEPDEVPDCPTRYPDVDGDGLGDDRLPVSLCEPTPGYVEVGGDDEPECGTNDTDDCGVCGGGNADRDCTGLCFGGAWVDGCGDCVGGATGLAPAPTEDWDADGIPDVCDQCPAEPQDRFVIEWSAVPHRSGDGGPYSFEIVLHAGGDILFQYRELEPFEATATVGLQSPSGDVGQTVSHDDDWLLGNPTVLYRWDAGSGDYVRQEDGPPLEWFSLEAVGDAITMGDDDVLTVTLPFTFPFYGEDFDVVRVSANGFVFLGDGSVPGHTNTLLPLESPGGLVAAFWDDLDPSDGGAVLSFHSPQECERDCAGVWGGFAAVDGCGLCAGGTTGTSPGANLDCAGVCDGEAVVDGCGLCAGGTTGNAPSDPENCPNLPDFTPDQDYLGDTLLIDYVDVEADSCLVAEGCVDGLGVRKVLRFGTRVGNIGTADLFLGVPPGPGYHWDACHEHYHYSDYASYELLDRDTGDPVVLGHKNGFCLLDSGFFDLELAEEYGSDCDTYDCGNQGIGVGCHDTYSRNLSCQWIDITDLADGTYDLQVTLNPTGSIPELDASNNSALVTVQIDGDDATHVE